MSSSSSTSQDSDLKMLLENLDMLEQLPIGRTLIIVKREFKHSESSAVKVLSLLIEKTEQIT